MEYGKFATLDDLVKGYNELEKSFTQKCQQLADIERQRAAAQLAQPASGTNEASSPDADSKAVEAHSTTVDSGEKVPSGTPTDAAEVFAAPAPNPQDPIEQQLQQYLLDNPEVVHKLLRQVQDRSVPAVMSGGGNVTLTPPNRPKSIKEASLMAQDLFK